MVCKETSSSETSLNKAAVLPAGFCLVWEVGTRSYALRDERMVVRNDAKVWKARGAMGKSGRMCLSRQIPLDK